MTDQTEKPPVIDPTKLWSRKVQVIEEIDRGGMGYILRGIDTKLRRELALKVAPLPRGQLPREQLARFIEEAQITAQLEHPNVVPVHEIGLDPEQRVYFSMKLVRGRSLESILDGRRQGDPETLAEFGLRRLLDIFLQVCQALEYAHTRGVIHRDIKPANIMVGDFGEVLVMDWGVAKVRGHADRDTSNTVTISPESETLDEVSELIDRDEMTSIRTGKKYLETQLGTVIGTPGYMSPEQAQGLPLDERTDLHALGVILYEIICGEIPYEAEDPNVMLAMTTNQEPKPPIEHNPDAPPALSALAVRLLDKKPARRLPIREVRTHVRNYLEGIERDFGRESLWSNAMWVVGALALFAFLVWYVTGQSIGALFVLAPTTVFNSIGWFLLVLAFRYPLSSAWVGIRRARAEQDRFQPPPTVDLYVAGFLSHRSWSAVVAPLFQLVFLVELVVIALMHPYSGAQLSTEVVSGIMNELRAEWGRALIVILIFLFLYLFCLYREVRNARRMDRYETLVERSKWEASWPIVLILILLVTIGLTDVLDWVVITGVRPLPYLRHLVMTQPLDVFDIAKTLVFQGTFLMGVVFATVLLAFPFPEVLAALRLPYQPYDAAAVRGRAQYFLRSLAVFRVARVNWLYGGAMIGCLTALAVLSGQSSAPLLQQVAYVLGPSLIGFVGYALSRRTVNRLLANSPALERLVWNHVENSKFERIEASLEHLSKAPVRRRFVELLVPVACIAGFLVFTGSGLHQQAIEQLIVPVNTAGWLLILPYVLLLPVILLGDRVQLYLLRRNQSGDEVEPIEPNP